MITSHSVVLNSQQIKKLQRIQLPQLKKLLQDGIIQVQGNRKIEFPISRGDLYLFLWKHKQSRNEINQQALQVIDKIILNDAALKSDKESNINEIVVLLQPQIIGVIIEIDPLIFRRYTLKVQLAVKEKQRILIDNKNMFGMGNFINLCLEYLRNWKLFKLSPQDILKLLQEEVLSFYLQKNLNQLNIIDSLVQFLLKGLILQFDQKLFQSKLSQMFARSYENIWKTIKPNWQEQLSIKLLEKQLGLMQIIHYNIPYPQRLITSGIISQHIKSMLMFIGENKATVHHLAINIYSKLAKQLHQVNSNSSTFSNIFAILSSYGVHLIKDVWPSFYSLLQGPSSVYSRLQQLELILWKLEHHENNNVLKHCMHDLLQHDATKLFEESPQIVYKTIVRMLNIGSHYQDCLYHMDSKLYPIICSFFTNYYNQPSLQKRKLEQHLEYFFEAIICLDNYDHAVVALMLVFQHINKVTSFFGRQLLNRSTSLLLKGYIRYPIRKRFQLVDSLLSMLQNHLNIQQISPSDLLQWVSLINQQYLIEPNLQRVESLFKKYSRQQLILWVKEQSQEILLQTRINIVYEKDDYELKPLLVRIQQLQLARSLLSIKVQHYLEYFQDMVIQFGQSQYKTAKQRYFLINAYYYQSTSMMETLNPYKYSKHLEAVLNLIAMYTSVNDETSNHKIGKITYQLFLKAYKFQQGQHFADRQEERVVVARMIQWAYDHIEEPTALIVILEALRARVTALRIQPNQAAEYNFFEQTLYEIYNKLLELQSSNWKQQNQLSFLSRNNQLRLQVLLITILLHDPKHPLVDNSPSTAQIGDIIDRYDFEKYEQVCWMIEGIYCKNKKITKQRMTDQEGKSLAHQFQLLLDNMMTSLEYSLQKKEILPLCETAINTLFAFINISGRISSFLVDFCIKLIKVGENYLIFQRAVSFTFTNQLVTQYKYVTACENHKDLIPLLIAILSVQQYRGFDSAIYCYSQNKGCQFYRQFLTTIQSNYYGAVPRFSLIWAIRHIIIVRIQKTNQETKNWLGAIIESCVQRGLAIGKERMFLSGKNKVKLQIWQFLLLFDSEIVLNCLGHQRFQQLLLKLIEGLNINMINQVRYYFELFLMRLLFNNESLNHKEVLKALKEGIIASGGNINKSVVYIVTSGIFLQHITLLNLDLKYFDSFRDEFMKLHTAILTFVGSSIAYFRGLSQYFCLSKISNLYQTKYLAILRQNYLLDKDAIILRQKLQEIIQQYIKDIQTWNVDEQILDKVPNENFNVVCNHYYLDRLKTVGLQLAKFNKNQDGYTAYRNIWKKNVNLENRQQQEQEEDILPAEIQQNKQQQNVFQRKIDMTMEINNFGSSGSTLKIIVVSTGSEALIGHLARTGQIFGIQQLIIPDIKVISKESFKSISVTAQRWLNITQIGGVSESQLFQKNVLQALTQNKCQGYQLVKLSKNKFRVNDINQCPKLPKKCLLIVDELELLLPKNCSLIEGELQLGRYFSLHVQASIIIWSYFKTYLK